MAPLNHHRRIIGCLVFLAGLGWCGIASAQPRAVAADRGGLNPEAFYGKESFQGVSVRDSLEAIKKLEDARRMERLKDWNKAADWYQEVLEKYGQYVVPSRTDEQKRTYQYTGIERPVQEQLAKWESEGLQAYKNRYGAIADTLLAGAARDDRETLSKVMKLYFVTDAGKFAGIRLMDLLLEGGDFAEAARIGDRLLQWHPNLKVETPRVLFRTVLAYHLSGDAKRAKERGDEMVSRHSEATGTIFGKDVVLAQSLERLLQNAPPVSIQTRANSIRYNPGGNEERSMISSAQGRPGARMASIELMPPPVKVDPNQMKQIEASQGRADSSTAIGVMPVVDDDEMFFQDGSRVYGVSLASGVPLPGWFQSYPSTSGTYVVQSFSFSRNQQHTLALTDNCVLAVMGAQDRVNMYGSMPVAGTDKGTRLVCLNRADGKERWVVKPKDRITEENIRQVEFSGSPLVVGDNVYVIGRGGKNYTEDCYVLCFDLNNGNYKWSCFIASASNGYVYYGPPTTSDTLSHLAYSSGRIYVLTNLGASAAIDAYAGTISWLNIYPRDNAGGNPEMGFVPNYRNRGASGIRAWEFNPVIVQDGKIFILPTDGRQNIMIYDAGSGAELKRISVSDFRSSEDTSGPTAILGVDGKSLVLTGGATVYCIDWTAYERGKGMNCIQWRSDFARQMGERVEKTDVMGRGFVTADSVFVCTRANLYRIERRTGKVRDMYPGRDRQWDTSDGEGPGNVVVTEDRVVVAGAKRVNVYADMTLARKRLDDDVAAAPGDPGPRLRYAEVMFVAGQLPVAMEKLDEAVKLLGGLKTMRSGNDRDHFFNDCITFATKLQRDIRGKSDGIDQTLESVNKLYDLAKNAADGDSQQVNYRMSRGKFNEDFRQEGSLATAVTLYQEILLNPRLRMVPLSDPEAGGTTQAALAAEKLIAGVKNTQPDTYERYEKASADALAAAGADPAMLKSVAESYPNSKSAPKALIAAAEAYENQGNSRLAAYTLRQVYGKYGDASERARMLEAMARNYLAMPDRAADRIDTAAARLATIKKLGFGENKLAKPLVLAGNKTLVAAGTSVDQALKAVQNYKSQTVAARLPDFHMPPPMTDAEREARRAEIKQKGDKTLKLTRDPFLPAEQQVVINDVTAIVAPPRELRQNHSRHDVIGVWMGANLVLYRAGTDQAIGRSSLLANQAKGLAWVEDNAGVLVWSDSEFALLRGDNADKKWKVELGSLPRIDIIAGADQTIGQKEDQVIGGNVAFARQRLIIQRGGMPGVVNPPAIVNPGGAEQILWVKPVGDRAIVATSGGQVFAVKMADGTLAWHTRLSSTAPIDRMVATDDFVACKLTEAAKTQIVALDTLTGQLVRRMIFPNETGNVPVNIALAPDGMLVWIQADRLCGKDLFEPDKKLNYEVAASQTDNARNPNMAMRGDGSVFNPIYAGATQSDQLLISEGRIIVVTHNGKFVSIHSLETGKLQDYRQEDGRPAEARLASAGGNAQSQIGDWGVSLRVVGAYLYVTSRNNGPMAYELDRPTQNWEGMIESNYSPVTVQYQDAMVGQGYFVVMTQPQRRPAAAGIAQTNNFHRMHAYTRMRTETGSESGLLVYSYDIRDESGITDFEGVDGGIYYLGGDKKLRFLKGARP